MGVGVGAGVGVGVEVGVGVGVGVGGVEVEGTIELGVIGAVGGGFVFRTAFLFAVRA